MRVHRLLPLVCGTALSFALPAHADPLLYVASGADNHVITIDTASNTPVGAPIPVGAGPLAPVASPDGTRVYVQSSADAHVYLIDARTRAVAAVVLDPTPTGLPQGLALSPDGSRLYLLEAGSIAVMDTADGAVVGRVAFDTAAHDQLTAVPSHDGRVLYVAIGAAHSVVAVDTLSLTSSAPIALNGGGVLRGLDIAPDDRTLYAADDAGGFYRIDTASRAVDATPLPSALGSVAVAPDGKHVYASAKTGACFVALDVASNVFSSTGIGANGCQGLALARNGSALYIATPGGAATPNWDLLAVDAANPLQNSYAAQNVTFPLFTSASIAPATIFPQPGMWGNPAESGRGFTIEVQGSNLVLIANVFDAQGNAQWFFSAGPYDAADGVYSGTLDGYTGGQCLGCAYHLPTYTHAAAGVVRATFTSATKGTLYFNNGSTPIEKLVW